MGGFGGNGHILFVIEACVAGRKRGHMQMMLRISEQPLTGLQLSECRICGES